MDEDSINCKNPAPQFPMNVEVPMSNNNIDVDSNSFPNSSIPSTTKTTHNEMKAVPTKGWSFPQYEDEVFSPDVDLDFFYSSMSTSTNNNLSYACNQH